MAGFGGRVIYVSANGEKVQCETNSTFTMETSVTDLSRCKGEAAFSKHIVGRNTWSLEVDANALLEEIATNQFSIIEAMIAKQYINIIFQSDPMYYMNDEKFAISGKVVAESFSWDNPGDAGSTWNASFKGSGPFTLIRQPNNLDVWSQDGLNAVINGFKKQMIYVHGAKFS